MSHATAFLLFCILGGSAIAVGQIGIIWGPLLSLSAFLVANLLSYPLPILRRHFPDLRMDSFTNSVSLGGVSLIGGFMVTIAVAVSVPAPAVGLIILGAVGLHCARKRQLKLIHLFLFLALDLIFAASPPSSDRSSWLGGCIWDPPLLEKFCCGALALILPNFLLRSQPRQSDSENLFA